MSIPTSRDNLSQIPSTLIKPVKPIIGQPIHIETFTEVKNGLTISDLRSGDIILMLGNYPSSCITCTCSLSLGSSHVGVVLELDGKLWLIEAISFAENDVKQWLVPNIETNPPGVVASEIDDNILYYSAMDVYRPEPPLTIEEIQGLKRSFYKYKGKPYEKSMLQLLNVAIGCPVIPTENSIFCSELVAKMFNDISRLNTDHICYLIPNWREYAHNYRPSDIPNIINCKRIGHMKGTRKILDFRGWTFGIC